jgi:ADP-heptose:LPS heptosyltransferase
MMESNTRSGETQRRVDRSAVARDPEIMRFLLARTDALGDLAVSLPVQARILSRDPGAEIHWLVQPATAPVLDCAPGIAAVHQRPGDKDLEALLRQIGPDALLNLGHRDRRITVAAKQAGIPIRVARARGLDQILAATHRIWKGRYGTGRHESQNLLDFLAPWNWDGGVPVQVPMRIPGEGRARAGEELHSLAGNQPALGVILRGSGAGAFPREGWWERALPVFRTAGWAPVRLGPAECSDLPATDLAGLLARLAACAAVVGPSTGPVHLAAALGVPVLCLMGLRPNHSPDRWAPLGPRVQVVQYPGPEDDLGAGMDRLEPGTLLPHLERLR